MQLIDKDKLKEALENEGADVFKDCGDYAEWGFSVELLYKIIDSLPVEVEDAKNNC